LLTVVEIENYKSISRLTLDLGQINVFVGANGAGKSNVLEAVALAAAASAAKLDTEFLASRGIRVTDPGLMRSSFNETSQIKPIRISASDTNNQQLVFRLANSNEPYAKWIPFISSFGGDLDSNRLNQVLERTLGPHSLDEEKVKNFTDDADVFIDRFRAILEVARKDSNNRQEINQGKPLHPPIPLNAIPDDDNGYRVDSHSMTLSDNLFKDFIERLFFTDFVETNDLSDFVIYSPTVTSLRTLDRESQIEPLGINGEGLLRFISVLSRVDDKSTIDSVINGMRLLDWFDSFEIEAEPTSLTGNMTISDRFLSKGITYHDLRSVNEGYLFLMFYFSLFSSDLTPRFFAVDNVDASLNPKLCERLMRELVSLSKKHNKQVLFTTHNPAILDGLNLEDEQQRLFVISRGRGGQTRAHQVKKPTQPLGESPMRLSEAFLRGSLGGLPQGF
jgi:predicted ATPase